MNDLIAQAAAAGLETRAVMPGRELGAYEALWARKGTSFKTLADAFRKQPRSIPSDFVPQREAEQYSRMALGAIREAGIRHFGIRVHGAGRRSILGGVRFGSVSLTRFAPTLLPNRLTETGFGYQIPICE